MLAVNQGKDELRRRMQKCISELSADERTGADRRICSAILECEAYRSASQLVGYMALSDEVNLASVLSAASSAGKRVYLPVVDGAGGLRFSRWSPGEEVVTSPLGIAEPRSPESPPDAPTISLIPGRAFDRMGNRLGRGGGYYDRSLAELKQFGVTLGIGYFCQLVDAVPVGAQDRRVGGLVTEAGLQQLSDEQG
jgi:5-formyltetrahydrofolate cyclo-ligase